MCPILLIIYHKMVFIIQKKIEFGSNNLKLITKKCVYPYDYMDGFDKFKEEGIPSTQKFHSKLTCEDVSNSDYNHAKNVWEEFKCKTMGDYHDVLTLAGKECYNLDPAHYLNCPVFAWDAMLKMTDINLELITDNGMYQMVETGLPLRENPHMIYTPPPPILTFSM